MKDIVALVTGAASGLGKATAAGLLLRGARVVGFDKNYKQAKEENFSELFPDNDVNSNNEFDKTCTFVKGDILSTDDVNTALHAASKKWGHVNVVVNCAGIPSFRLCYSHASDKCFPLSVFRDLLNTNVSGTFNVVRLAAQQMAKNDLNSAKQRGVIINTSSIDAYNGLFGSSSLSAGAGAIASMTLPIARDLSSLGIRVMSIAPGYFDTPINDFNSKLQDFVGNCNIFPNCLGDPKSFFECVLTIIDNEMLNGEVIRLDAGCHIPVIRPSIDDDDNIDK